MSSLLHSPPRSPSRSSTSSGGSDATMLDAPPSTPAQPRHQSQTANTIHHEQSSSSVSVNMAETKSPDFSLLLSLPRELRDRVYNYALHSPSPFWWPTAVPSPPHNIAPALLRTCRQIHDEACPILYSCNKFLFTHPSDCTVFRVIASKHSERITSVCFRIRTQDVRLWTAYLGSGKKDRSLQADLPNLKSLWVFLRCGNTNVTPGAGGNALLQQLHAMQAQSNALMLMLNQQQQGGQPPPLGFHVLPLQPQFQAQAQGNNAVPPPPPPAPQQPTNPNNHWQIRWPNFNPQTAPQNTNIAHLFPGIAWPVAVAPPPLNYDHLHLPPGVTIYAGFPVYHPQTQLPQNPQVPLGTLAPIPGTNPVSAATLLQHFLRRTADIGLESLCTSLQGRTPPNAEVKVVCIMRLPRAEVQRLRERWPTELLVTKEGDGECRTRFRRLWGVEVSLEVGCLDL